MSTAETVLAVVALVGVPLAALVWEFRQYDLTLKLRDVGLRARGEVLHTRWGFKHSDLVVKYVLHLEDGSEVRGEYGHPRALKPYPAVGDALEALYLPHNPQRHQVVGMGVKLAKLVVDVVGLGLVMILTVHLLVVDHRKQQALEARGSTPPSRLRTYEEPTPPSRPHPTREKHQVGAY
ncbi:hypothetical protein [Corallococcus sp. EGB]|uniref:DUF3592 domain-containing protein n=1 Tax=Corallococcus sp. EGB TaxID=1521117 RepID=UPI001CC04BDD|nr:hypothetical protein [Corallococcus sp. EGB]